MVPSQRVSVGRKRIEIRRIESKDARQVCFSKRRAGLFNKVSDLSTLCGVQIAVVVFSPGGKVFSLGHPSVKSVLDRFLAETPEAAAAVAAAGAAESGLNREEKRRSSVLEDLNRRYDELHAKLEMEEVRKEYWNGRMAAARAKNSRVAAWVEEAGVVEEDDMGEYRAALMNVHELVNARVDLVLRSALATRGRGMRAPSLPLHVVPAPLTAGSGVFFNMSQLSGFQQMAMGGGMMQDFGVSPPPY